MTTFKPSRPLEYTCQLRISYTDSRPDKIIPYVTRVEAFSHVQWVFHEPGVRDFVIEDWEPEVSHDIITKLGDLING